MNTFESKAFYIAMKQIGVKERIGKRAVNVAIIVMLATTAAACRILSKTGEQPVKVKGTIAVEQPVCGEMPVKSGQHKSQGPVASVTYYIKEGATNDPAVIARQQFTTDENGAFAVTLRPGTYAVLHADKLMSYADFKLKHFPRTNYFREKDDDCFARWYSSPDFLLTVSSDTTVTWLVKSRCYTGGNPCVEYTGSKNP